MPALPCKLPHAEHIKQCVFFGRLWVAPKRACFCGRVALKRTGCLQQMFKMMPLCLHTCTQSCSPLINSIVMKCKMPECLSTVPVSISFFSNLYSLHVVQPLLENSHINCGALYPFNSDKLLIKTLPSALKSIFTQRTMTLQHSDVGNASFPSFHFRAK